MTEDDNPYWNAEDDKVTVDDNAHAILESEYIDAKWTRNRNSIDAANRAFCIYYHGMKTINSSISSPHWGTMYETLEKCAKKGAGSGVSDLQEALFHYARNDGGWNDGNSKNYFGGNGKSYNRTMLTMAEGPANFLKAVDGHLPLLKNLLDHYQVSSKGLAELNPGSNPSTTDLEKFGTRIAQISKVTDYARHLAWIMPAAIEAHLPIGSSGFKAMEKVEAFADGASKRLKFSISLLGVVGNINDGLKVYADATQAFGGDRRVGLAFAGLSYAMTHVPVLGGFYGTIVSKIPGLVNNWREFIQDYTRRFDDPEAFLRERANRKPPWRCPICKSSGGYH